MIEFEFLISLRYFAYRTVCGHSYPKFSTLYLHIMNPSCDCCLLLPSYCFSRSILYPLQAMRTTCMYHLGTAAFGSLIIAVIKTIRSVLAYIQKHAKASKNKVIEYLMCVLQCCMWCLEKCAKFLNKNAYIQTSIYGFSFCKSSRRAFFLILRNILRISVVNAVADFVLILGKVSDFEYSSIAVSPTTHPCSLTILFLLFLSPSLMSSHMYPCPRFLFVFPR
jgi:hypothetical protein